MKKILLYIFLVMVASAPDNALACNVCHSKNPKMVQMHKELGYKDCFSCHTGPKKSAEEQKRQRENDVRCVNCHKKDK